MMTDLNDFLQVAIMTQALEEEGNRAPTESANVGYAGRYLRSMCSLSIVVFFILLMFT